MADATLKPGVEPLSVPANDRLESWKEIAAYLKRDLRTVQRWEKREGLPIHRHMHSERGSVYAFKAEIDAWWANGRIRLDSNGVTTALPPPRRRWLMVVASLSGLTAALVGWLFVGLARKTGWFGRDGRGINGPALRRLQSEYIYDPYAMPSPDGTKLAYFVVENDAWLMKVEDLHTGKAKEYSKRGSLFQAWSPDGTELAFREDQAVKVINLTSGATHVLVSSPDQRINPVDWSQDGKTILAITRNPKEDIFRLAVISARDGNIQPVKNWKTPGGVDSTPQLSPDGRFIALTVELDQPKEHAYIYTASGEQRTRLTNYLEQENDPVWSSDGKYIAFRRENGDLWDLWAVPVAGGKPSGEPFLIKSDIGNRVWMRRWTAAGELEFLQYNGGPNLFSVPMDAKTGRPTGKPEKLIRESMGNCCMAWLAGGKSFLFLSRKKGFGWPSLEIAPGRKTEDEQVLGQDYFITDPVPSPDGKYVAFAGWDAKVHLGIYLAALSTRKIQPLMPEPHVKQEELSEVIGWLPGSRTLVFGDPRQLGEEKWDEDVFTIGLDGGGRHKIARIGGRLASLSPDGSRIAYADWGNRSIEVFSVLDQKRTTLARYPKLKKPPSWPRWSPDGTKIVFQIQGESGSPFQLWVVPASGGEALKVTEGTPDAQYPLDPRWSPDGKRIAYTSATTPTGYQLWAIEGFLPAK
jgi:Tol biopolymer transport system component